MFHNDRLNPMRIGIVGVNSSENLEVLSIEYESVVVKNDRLK